MIITSHLNFESKPSIQIDTGYKSDIQLTTSIAITLETPFSGQTQLDPYLSNGNCSDQEKREIIIELNTSRCKILKDLPVLPPFKFENIKTVTHLLKEINRHLHDRYKKGLVAQIQLSKTINCCVTIKRKHSKMQAA